MILPSVKPAPRAKSVEIKPLNDNLAVAYDAFLARHPGAMLYYSRSYVRLVEAVSGARPEIWVAVCGEEVNGIWPTMVRDGAFGVVLNSLPYFGSHGSPIAETPEAESALLNWIAERTVREFVAASVIIENPLTPVAAIPYHCVLDERVSQITVLVGQDKLLNAIDPSARRNIRKAIASGITVDIDHTAIDFLFETHVENMAAIGGRPKGREVFERIVELFEPGRDWDLFVAKLAGKPVAAILVFYFKDIVEYFTPVTLASARPYQPTALIIQEAMLEAHRRGFSRWNWGGTWLSQDSVYKFKRKWGAEDRRYRYFVALTDLDILQQTPKSLREHYPEMYVAPYIMLGG